MDSKKFSFTADECRLFQDAIQTWLLCDFGPQCVEMQEENAKKKKEMKRLYDYINEVLKGDV